jgi:peptidoglycan/xylan/chitin deacetylase (PgdA/CDA1 family)
MTLRTAAKNLAYRSGAMDFFHRARHRECLTVLMFHRVLPASECRRSEADPLYAITPELLAGIVEFLKQNYAIVGVRDILSSLSREHRLPDLPVLITFDDGWRDNLEWALPVLRDVPWTLFVATDAMSEAECWWQEVLLWTLRSGRASYGELWGAVASDRADAELVLDDRDILALLLRYGNVAPEHRFKLLMPHKNALRSRCCARHMLTAGDLSMLHSRNVDIGSHGASHLPLSRMEDAAGDLRRSHERLQPLGSLPVLSFPHGRYNAEVIKAARELGYRAIFTSDAVLNPCPGGWLLSNIIGRISLNLTRMSDGSGAVAPDRLASQLYLRDIGITAAQVA